jgi:hypothetical protein
LTIRERRRKCGEIQLLLIQNACLFQSINRGRQVVKQVCSFIMLQGIAEADILVLLN